MSKLSGFVTFALGAAIGSAVAWYYTKQEYEKILQGEINEIKKVYTYKKPSVTEEDHADRIEEPVDIANAAKEKPSVSEYAKQLSKEGYVDYTTATSKEEKNEVIETEVERDPMRPYVISPDNFGEYDDYDTITFTYYSDHILADENDEPVEDVDNVIGYESLNHFGEYEDDVLFVRSDKLKIDYEILQDDRKYLDVVESKPYLMED